MNLQSTHRLPAFPHTGLPLLAGAIVASALSLILWALVSWMGWVLFA